MLDEEDSNVDKAEARSEAKSEKKQRRDNKSHARYLGQYISPFGEVLEEKRRYPANKQHYHQHRW